MTELAQEFADATQLYLWCTVGEPDCARTTVESVCLDFPPFSLITVIYGEELHHEILATYKA